MELDSVKLESKVSTAFTSAAGKGLKIPRVFTSGIVNPFLSLDYETRVSVIKNSDGSTVSEIKGVEVPRNWSQVATDILAQKYFRKSGVPQFDEDGEPLLDASGKQLFGSEYSLKQVVKRLSGCWRYWGEKHGYFASSDDAKAFEDELAFILLHQLAAPNSPQWFNTGLHWAYGITGPAQGHYYVDPTTRELVKSTDAYSHPAPHACFIQSLKDDLVNEGGIFDLLTREARVFKYGAGCTSGDSFVFTDSFGLLRIRDLYSMFSSQGRFAKDFDGKGKFIEIADANVHTFSIDSSGVFKRDLIEKVWSYDVAKEDKLAIKLNNGSRVVVSSWHPFLVWDGVRITTRRADALKRGDAVLGANSTVKPLLEKSEVRLAWESTYFEKQEHHEIVVDDDLAWLLGYFMGDGSLGKRFNKIKGKAYVYLRLRFFDESIESLARVKRILFDKFNASSSIRPDSRRTSFTLQCVNRRASTFFGKLFGSGSKVYRLQLPSFITKLGTNGISAFLAGLLDSDGSVTKDGKAVYSSSSREFSSQVAVLASLLNCGGGIKEDRSVRTAVIVHKSCLPQNTLLIAQHVTNNLRKRRLEDSIARAHRTQYCMPIEKQALANVIELPLSPSKMFGVEVAGSVFHLGRVQYGGLVNPRKLSLMLSSIQNSQAQMLSRIAESLCFVTDVSKLTSDIDFYDLTVKENNNYLAGESAFAVIHNSGTNFSSLRGSNEPLSGGGYSSGLMSFLKIYDRAAAAVKSGGTTRRAAKMVCLDADHPDIEEFVEWKMREEQKVVDLVAGSKIVKQYLSGLMRVCTQERTTDYKNNKAVAVAMALALKNHVPLNYVFRVLELDSQGVTSLIDLDEFDTHYESEAYVTVSGQNSNNSVRLPNSFMQSMLKNGEWQLLYRTNGKVAKSLKAMDLWNKISFSAWACADPGIQFDDTINEWHTCPIDGRINASNPCSEYMFLDDTACNLASINLAKFWDEEKGVFDVMRFQHAVRLWTIVLEISVLMAQFTSKEMALKSFEFRTLGLGYANLGTLLMVMGVAYDSPQGRSIAGALTSIMCGESYAVSAEMSASLGHFGGFERNREPMLRVIRNHRRAAYNAPDGEYEGLTVKPQGITPEYAPSYLVESARESWDRALALGEKHGYRNAQVTVTAPTGTIGLIMDCDTTGVEPDFALVKFKKLAGGGYFKIVNQSVSKALKRLGYTPEQIRDVELYTKGRGTLYTCPHINPDSLSAKGFTSEKIAAVEKSLLSAFDIRFAFNKYVLGEDFCINALHLPREKLDAPDFDLLKEIGFTKLQIREANDYVCGTMTVEGAPHLKDEHYAVFDCASKCGPYGKRFLSTQAHLTMMSAVQPFISGAISKTINMQHEATIEDVKKTYLDSWQLMLKAVALYRDGSKLSQPLNTSASEEEILGLLEDGEDDAKKEVDERIGPTQLHAVAVNQVSLNQNTLVKRKLPGKRRGFVQEGRVGGHKVYIRTGEYPDGTLGEVFIDMYKEGAAYRSLMNCFAISVSKALQYGVPLEEFVDSFTFTRFEPAGVVTGNDNIKSATSVIDYLFRVLGYEYLDRTDLIHVPDEQRPTDLGPANHHAREEKQRTLETQQPPTTPPASTKSSDSQTAKTKGYTGEMCSSCGSMRVKRSGSCGVCEDCGTTTGCS